jgi:hypothetical protein
VQGVENANRALMDAGTERHRTHGQKVWRATLVQSAAALFFLIAVGAILLLALRIFGVL